MTNFDGLIIAPFRRPTFRSAISSFYPIEEPWDSPPLLIAGAVEATGASVRYLPLQNIFLGFDEERDQQLLREILNAHSARLVIYASDNFIASRSTAALYGIRLISKLLKGELNAPIVGVVGRLATTAGESLFNLVPEVDFLVRGEAEIVIAKIAEEVLNNGLSALEGMEGVLTRPQISRGLKNIQVVKVKDLNSLPLPAYHLLEPAVNVLQSVRGRPLTKIPFSLRTSLGCKFQCKFCAGVPFWREYRMKSGDRVGSEIDALSNAIGDLARLSFLEDEIFTLNENHVRSVAEVLRQRNLVLDGLYTHSSLMTSSIARALSLITNKVFLGLDNADDEILRTMGKGQSLDMVLSAVEVARQSSLKVHLEWIIGSPKETVSTLITSLGAIFNLIASGAVDSINTYIYCPHPGTEYAENSKAYGIKILDNFEEIQESGGFPAYETPHLTRNQIFSAYLMSQIVIAEAKTARDVLGTIKQVRGPNKSALQSLFDRISSEDRKQ